MGRYVYGDFEHKFWFAIQESDVIETFGGCQGNMIHWYWNKRDLPVVESRLKDIWKECIKRTGNSPRYWLSRANKHGVSLSPNNSEIYKWAADFELGIRIRRAIKDLGDVYVEAEYE